MKKLLVSLSVIAAIAAVYFAFVSPVLAYNKAKTQMDRLDWVNRSDSRSISTAIGSGVKWGDSYEKGDSTNPGSIDVRTPETLRLSFKKGVFSVVALHKFEEDIAFPEWVSVRPFQAEMDSEPVPHLVYEESPEARAADVIAMQKAIAAHKERLAAKEKAGAQESAAKLAKFEAALKASGAIVTASGTSVRVTASSDPFGLDTVEYPASKLKAERADLYDLAVRLVAPAGVGAK